MKYFVLRNDKVQGPFSRQQLSAAIKHKKLRRTDLIAASKTGPWQSIAEVLGGRKIALENATEPVETTSTSDAANTPADELDFPSLPDVLVASSLQQAAQFVQHRTASVQNPADSASINSFPGSADTEQVDKPRLTRKDSESILEGAAKELEERESNEAAERAEKQKQLYIVGGGVLAVLVILVPLTIWVGAGVWNGFFGNKVSDQAGEVLDQPSDEAIARREQFKDGFRTMGKALKKKDKEQFKSGAREVGNSLKSDENTP